MTSTCAACGLSITETERQPCPECGCINRVVAVTADDTLEAADQA